MKPAPAPEFIPVTRPWLPDQEQYLGLVKEILESRQLSNFARHSKLLEERAVDVLGHSRPLCASSCDVAMILAWRALGVREGEVLVPSFTLCSTVNALRWNGLRPVFVDIHPETLTMDPADARRRVTEQTVAIAAVHTFGRAADADALEALADEHSLKLLFDAAHAVGTRLAGQPLGLRGDAALFSLSGTKLATSGEGGLATFRDPDVTDRFELLRSYGFMHDYDCRAVGINAKISEMNAALGWLSLQHVEEAVARRQELVAAYREALAGIPELRFQAAATGTDRHSYKDLAVLFPDETTRNAAERALEQIHVQTKRYFLPVHTMGAYREWANASLPVTDDVYRRILCLPLYHDLAVADIERIAATAVRAVKAGTAA